MLYLKIIKNYLFFVITSRKCFIGGKHDTFSLDIWLVSSKTMLVAVESVPGP
jgi:hypothetical protein